MKIHRLIVLGCLCALVSLQAVKAQRLSKTEAEEVMWDYLEKYTPDRFQMMQNLKTRPTKFQLGITTVTLASEAPAVAWVDELTSDGVLKSLNTIVHETVHGFTSSWPFVLLGSDANVKYRFSDNYSAYYLAQDEVYLVKHTKVFNSNKIAPHIPESLKTFRYDPYIYPISEDLGSQVQGIYGLMDEWNAYYHGTKTAYNLFDHYQELAKNEPEIYLEHISDLAGTYFAYYEFKYYILSYMILARNKYPEVYSDILTNYELRNAYRAVDEKFDALIGDFQLRLDNLVESVNSESGSTRVAERNGYYFIGRKGVGLFVKERDSLKKELAKDEFMEMDRILKPMN